MKDAKAVSNEIIDKSLDFIGQLGVARAGIQVLDWNAKSQRGLIKVNHKYVDEAKSSLAFIKTINNQKVIVNSVGVSGIIAKAKEKYIK